MPPQFLLFQNAVGLCGFIDLPLPEKFFLKVHSENFLLFYSSSASILLDRSAFHFFAPAGWSLPLARIKYILGNISLEKMKLGGY